MTMRDEWTKSSLLATCETVRLRARFCVMMLLVIPFVSVWVALDGVGDLCSDHLCSGDERMFPCQGTFEVTVVYEILDFFACLC